MTKTKNEGKNKKSSPLYNRLVFPMVVLSLLQMLVFVMALWVSGEFAYIRQYAYNMFIEKNENRRVYVENTLAGKVSSVYDAAEDIVYITEKVLKEMDAEIEDISTDKNVNKEVLRRSASRLIELMRVSASNDVYIILNSGELYNKENTVRRSGFYLRDLDITTGSKLDNSDLLMEMGSADIAKEYGITLDSAWETHLNLSDLSERQQHFYLDTVKNAVIAEEQGMIVPMSQLGHWSSFTSISETGIPSMKFTVPLISQEGTVYGVIGIGILEKTLLSAIPSNDLLNKSSCYILCVDSDRDGVYNPVIHSGAMYNRLVNENTVISEDNKLAAGIYNFNQDTGMDIVGCISKMKLYNAGSPYIKDSWALVSIADGRDILSIYYNLLNTMFLSTLFSAGVCLVIALFISRGVTKPVKDIAKLLDLKMEDGGTIQFEPSGITEIDKLSGSISELQIAVKEQASRVSKIISMADMGIGVFMYEEREKTVFVGEGFIKLIESETLPAEDMVLSRKSFYKLIGELNDKALQSVHRFMDDVKDNTVPEETVEFYCKRLNKWLRCSVILNENRVLGILMDITSNVLEKQKIEYERDYDLITGLLNRRAYLNRIGALFAEPDNLGVAAIIMWDLDNLKYVNDTYGHDYGDKYIQSAAEVLKLFHEYGGVVARLSGDEFNVFLYGFKSKDEIRGIIDKVWDVMERTYCTVTDGTRFKVRASGGVSWYPDDSDAYEYLAKYADFAMYTVKHSTKGMIAEFDRSTYNKDSILITGVEEMNRIIDEQSIKYAFQSIISAKTGELFGYEALMRPQSDVIRSPLEFIRIAKTAAKLHEIERMTWFNALRKFREMRDRGRVEAHVRVFVNSLPDCRLTSDDMEKLERENKEILDRVVIEILEGEQSNGTFMKGKQDAIARWRGLIALDDFGTGYNNEYALITLSPDIIKIDRSIISGCDTDISRRNIILNLVNHSRMRNILVLAEGVETEEEMKTVIECGVDLLQGYYIDRPDYEPLEIPQSIKDKIIHYAENVAE